MWSDLMPLFCSNSGLLQSCQTSFSTSGLDSPVLGSSLCLQQLSLFSITRLSSQLFFCLNLTCCLRPSLKFSFPGRYICLHSHWTWYFPFNDHLTSLYFCNHSSAFSIRKRNLRRKEPAFFLRTDLWASIQYGAWHHSLCSLNEAMSKWMIKTNHSL